MTTEPLPESLRDVGLAGIALFLDEIAEGRDWRTQKKLGWPEEIDKL